MANAWGTPPWVLDGEELTPWGAYVWQARFVLYENEKLEKQQRDYDEMRNQHGG